MDELPTDEEFLQTFFVEPPNYKIPEPDSEYFSEMIRRITEAGGMPKDVDPLQYVKEIFDDINNPNIFFRGPRLQSLIQDFARKALPDEEHYLLDIPVGVRWITEINGMAVRSPRGNPVIVLNRGILVYSEYLCRCLLSMITYGGDDPYCRDHEPFDFMYDVFLLSKHVSTQDPVWVTYLKSANCPSLDQLEIGLATMCGILELFILLHEYGHIVKGHLGSCVYLEDLEVFVYSQNHVQELEADEYAFSRITNIGMTDLAASAVATLFCFMDLVEHMIHGGPKSNGTHPSARDRWNALKRLFDLTPGEQNSTYPGRVEMMFDKMLEVRNDIDLKPRIQVSTNNQSKN